MPRRKAQQSGADTSETLSAASMPPRAWLRDLFRVYPVPPTPLHREMQNILREEGWIAPPEAEKLNNEKRQAGKSSARQRGGRAEIRRSLLMAARELLL